MRPFLFGFTGIILINVTRHWVLLKLISLVPLETFLLQAREKLVISSVVFSCNKCEGKRITQGA